MSGDEARWEGIRSLFGRAQGANVVIETRRGVEIPLQNSHGWSVEALHETLSEIDALPETPGDWSETPW